MKRLSNRLLPEICHRILKRAAIVACSSSVRSSVFKRIELGQEIGVDLTEKQKMAERCPLSPSVSNKISSK
jgi:hypothetical protein